MATEQSLISSALELLSINDDDLAFLEDPDYEFSVKSALSKLSTDRPYKVTSDGLGVGKIKLPLPTDFKALSLFYGVEYPVDSLPTSFIDRNDVQTVMAGSAISLTGTVASQSEVTCANVVNANHFKVDNLVEVASGTATVVSDIVYVTEDGNPTTGIVKLSAALSSSHSGDATIGKPKHVQVWTFAIPEDEPYRIHYSRDYVIGDIDISMERGVVSLVAYHIANYAAAKFAKLGDSSTDVEVADFTNMSERWTGVAEKHLSDYEKKFGIGSDGAERPVSVRVDLDVQYPWSGGAVTRRNWRR